jgi:gluconokinase
MKPGMLESQFKTLEEPEKALVVNIDQTPQEIVDNIKEKLDL